MTTIIPQQPTISIYKLVNGEYELQQFRENNSLISQVFPELDNSTRSLYNVIEKKVVNKDKKKLMV